MRMNSSFPIQQLRRHWRSALLIHLFFTLLGIAVLTPLFGALLQGLLAMSGSAAVADQDIARLLLTPLGLCAGIFMVSLLLAIAALEVGALQTFAQATQASLALTPRQAIGFSLRRALPLLKTTLGLTVRVLIYLLPFLATLVAIAALFLREYDINYYLSQRPPQFYYALAAAAAPAVLFTWLLGRRLLGWSLVLPIVLFSDNSPHAAFALSQELTRGRLIQLLRSFSAWLLLAVALSVIPVLFLDLSTGALVKNPGQQLATLAFLLGATALCWSVLNFLVIALNLAGFTFVLAGLYDELGPALPPRSFTDSTAPAELPERDNIHLFKLLISVAVIAVLAGGLGVWLLRDIKPKDDVLVIAHRGAAGAAPENTLAAIRLAIDDGADWVEIDVQESRDGQVMVVHDSDFMKLSNNPLKVWEGSAREIGQIDVGSWFAEDFHGERVPTLQQVLAEIKGRSRLVIELKYYGHDEQLEQRVVDIVEQAGMADSIVVMSLKLQGVQKIQALRPKWHAGLLAATALGDLSRLDVDFLAVNQNMATRGFIRRAHASGKRVFVWTINDALSLSHWMSMGVDGVITDEPALARDILAQRAQLSSAERLLLSAALFFGSPDLVKKYRDSSP